MVLTDEVRAMLPSCCQKCGLHEKAKRWNIPPEEDTRPEIDDGAPYILVIGKHPGWMEDEEGRHMINPDGGGGFLRQFLEGLDVRWILDQAVGCFPGLSPKWSVKFAQYCSEFRGPVIADPRIKCIVALGLDALKSVLGKRCPKSLKAAGTDPIVVEGLPPILATSHPYTHIMWEQDKGGYDLEAEYLRVFALAEELAHGVYKKPKTIDPPFESIWDPEKAKRAFRNLRAWGVYFDCETNTDSDAPGKQTIWHPDARLLCISFVFIDDTAKRHRFVIYGPALNEEVVRAALANRIVTAHNLMFDAQAVYVLL